MKLFRTFPLLAALAAVVVAGCQTTKSGGCCGGTCHAGGGCVMLFDGTSTDAWRGFKQDAFPAKSWKMENGLLQTIPGGPVVDLVTKEKFESFDLSLEWKLAKGGNSGVMCRVTEDYKTPWQTGPEMQVFDDAQANGPKHSSGALYDLIAPVGKQLKPLGEWNRARLVVRGNHVEHWLNGVKVVAYDFDSPELATLIAASKFKEFPLFSKVKAGAICLQNHHTPVWYRNICLKRL